jgi:Spirocyclase AveC-like
MAAVVQDQPQAGLAPSRRAVDAGAGRASVEQQALRVLVVVGAVFAAWQLQTWISWAIAGPHQITAYRPAHHHSAWYLARVYEAATIVLALATATYVIRGCARRRGLTVDAIICIISAGCFWLDSADSWMQPSWMYSSQWVNLNAPTPHMFLVRDPIQNFAEPFLFMGLLYAFGFLVFAMIINSVQRAAHRRWPAISTLSLIGIAWLVAFVIDLGLEVPMYHVGLWTTRAPQWMKIFGSGSKGEPLSEIALAAVIIGGIASLRYFKDDQGRILVQRTGALRGWRAGAVAILAGLAISNTLLFVGNLGSVIAGWYTARMPAASLAPDLLNGNCGPGSAYGICPGEAGYTLRLDTTKGVDYRSGASCAPAWMNNLACSELSNLSLPQLRARARAARVTHPDALSRKDLILALS